MNKPLLKQIIDKIREHPEQWAQGAWHSFPHRSQLIQRKVKETPFCETAHCVAGWAFVLDNTNAGREWYRGNDNFLNSFGELVLTTQAHWDICRMPWSDVGQQLLELSYVQANYLFHPNRTFDEIVEFYYNDGEVPEFWDEDEEIDSDIE